jgi:pimeloyl-ACP methyl ester carboxylesterase
VYVLHSGLHSILSDPAKNVFADALKEALVQRGVSARDVIVLENPFPTASWRNLFPWEGLTMFLDSFLPSSRVSHDLYLRMHRVFQAQGILPQDEVIWVGHSAGGQVGMTMALLAQTLTRYPTLARAAPAYRFAVVITLGAPVGVNPLPSEVKVRHYFSPDDRVVQWASLYGSVALKALGFRVALRSLPPSLPETGKIRFFYDVEHPFWDADPRVLTCILEECSGSHEPWWRSPLLSAGVGTSVVRLLCQGLDEHCNISLEDPPRASPR